MGRLFGFLVLFLVIIAAIMVSRNIFISLPFVPGGEQGFDHSTPYSTVEAQQRVLAETLGGAAGDYEPDQGGFRYEGGSERVSFTVPKGALVDTSKGVRWEGQRINASEFYIWWP